MQRTSFFPLLSLFLLLASIPLSVRPHRYVRATDMLFSQKANGRHVRLIPRIIFFKQSLSSHIWSEISTIGKRYLKVNA